MSGAPLGRSAAILLAGRAAQVVLGLAQVKVLFAALSKADAGRFAYVTSLALLLATISDVGTTTIAAREAARDPKREAALVGALLFSRLATAASATAVFAALLFGTLGGGASLGGLLAGLTILLGALSGAEIVFQVRQRFFWPTALRVLSHAALVAGLVLLDTRGSLGLDGALCVFAAASAVSPLGVILLARRIAPMRPTREGARDLLRLSLPQGVATAFVMLYFHMGTILLRNWKGDEATAVYGAAMKLFGFAVLAPGLVMVSVIPVLARDRSRDPLAARRLYARVLRIFLAVAAGGLAALVNLAPPIIDFLYGLDRYADSVAPLLLLGVALLFVAAGSVASGALVAYGGQSTWMRIAGLSAALSVAANVALIGPFGPAGAAAATALTEGTVAVLAVLAVRRLEGALPFSRATGWAALAAVLGFGVSYVLKDEPLVVSVTVSALAVAAVVYRSERGRESPE